MQVSMCVLRIRASLRTGASVGQARAIHELERGQSIEQDARPDEAASGDEDTGRADRSDAEHLSPGVALYVATIFAAAFLIFLVQPLVGKRILPWFGGVPAVWSACLAFYQITLFAGYAYAHALMKWIGPKQQVAVHCVAIAGALFSLPVLPEVPPGLGADNDPVSDVVGLLTERVAPSFLVLASTGPLIQAWLARAHPKVSPYSLYAVSNLGSFLALFAYPLVIEPRISVSATGQIWAWIFAGTSLLVVACGIRANLSDRASGVGHVLETEGTPDVDSTEVRGDDARRGARSNRIDALLWILQSAAAVVVLMGVTNKLCLEVASFPFLWMVPLATYLSTFIVAFGSARAYRRVPFSGLAIASYLVTRAVGLDDGIVIQAGAYCMLLFSTCMILHGEIYRSRPSPTLLTRFYLCVSAGGALGGLFGGLIAPIVFDDYHELTVGLLLALALVLSTFAREPWIFLGRSSPRWRWGGWSLAGAILFAFVAQPLWTGLNADSRMIHKERSFFGVLTIDEVDDGRGPQRRLTNGTTMHGTQFLDPREKRLPTSYYGRGTGLGLALAARSRGGLGRVGVVGLGVGTIAAYGRRGDDLRFYEIDPVVARLAMPGGAFDFLADSKARVDVVVGDARRSIEEEQAHGKPQNFDFLVLDAFTSDSIPIHLMTREAFESYLRALAPDGLLAVHVSNRHFQLMNLVSRLAIELGAPSLQIQSAAIPELRSGLSDWVLIARDSDTLTRLRIRIEKRIAALKLPLGSVLLRRGDDVDLVGTPLWTDDYSDLLAVVRWY